MDIKIKKGKTLKAKVIEAFEAGMTNPVEISKKYFIKKTSVNWYISKLGLSKCKKNTIKLN